jgi:hypothetical protein
MSATATVCWFLVGAVIAAPSLTTELTSFSLRVWQSR